MKIYNETKTYLIENPDLSKGYLKNDKLIKLIPEQLEVKEVSHQEIIKEYPNGGKDVKKVIDIPYQPYKPAREEIENIQVYIPYTPLELLENEKNALRSWRDKYFEIIDCAVWYDCLSDTEKAQVKQFRLDLLDITKTMQKPAIPECVAIRVK